jgi:hypothetical protein
MALRDALETVIGRAPESIEDLRRNVDPEWVLRALEASGVATLRKRRLPAEQVVWLAIGMALYRNRSIHEVVGKLGLALPGQSPTVVSSSVFEARARVGAEPLKWLFQTAADKWARESAGAHLWRGLSVWGVDGTTLRVADTKENAEAFGYAKSVRGESAYPMVRATALMALRSHLLLDVAFGDSRVGEVTYAKKLWSKVPDHSLMVVDRGFFSAALLLALTRKGKNRHWLTRAKKNPNFIVLRSLGPGDDLIEMKVSPEARKADPSLPERWQMRAIRYQRKGFRPQTLLTSLVDLVAFPATEIVGLYHERWEIELGYDEVKTEMLEREETLRSKSPIAVEQEIWGLFLAYNLVRLEMERVAKDLGVEPTRISFRAAFQLISDEWLWCAIASPGAIPRHLSNLRRSISWLVLPERRTARAYPRAVKIKMSNYPRKRRPPAVA